MKTLLIVRHAHSDPGGIFEKDVDRHLSKTGHAEAAIQAKKVKKIVERVDVLLTSDANRAAETCSYFAAAYGGSEKVQMEHRLYNAPANAFYEVLAGFDKKINTMAVFAHNPGITEFANSLGVKMIDHMPTAGVFAITISAHDWSSFAAAPKQFLFFERP